MNTDQPTARLCTSPWRGHARDGFTMLELMITLSIALVISAMASSSLSLILNRTRENQQVLEIEGHFREARSIARSRMQQVEVRISSGYLLVQPEGDAAFAYPLGAQIATSSLTDDDGVITFNSAGGLDELVAPVITLVTKSDRTYQYTVLPAIGTLRVESM